MHNYLFGKDLKSAKTICDYILDCPGKTSGLKSNESLRANTN